MDYCKDRMIDVSSNFKLLLDCLLTVNLPLAIQISALTSETSLEVKDHCAGHIQNIALHSATPDQASPASSNGVPSKAAWCNTEDSHVQAQC